MLRLAPRPVNRKWGAAADEADGLEAPGPTPKTSRPSAQHRIYPYLRRGLVIGGTRCALPISPRSGWPPVAAICMTRLPQRCLVIGFSIISRAP
jgi:hypothetical protein